MFTDYSQPSDMYPAEIGKFPWKKIWAAVKTVASTLFPGPYAIAAGAVSLFGREGGPAVNGIGALTDEQIEKRQWVQLMKQLTPEQRKQINSEAAKILQTDVAVVQVAEKEAVTDSITDPNKKWLWLGGIALAAYIFWPKRN